VRGGSVTARLALVIIRPVLLVLDLLFSAVPVVSFSLESVGDRLS
jgi:hypothetical protein